MTVDQIRLSDFIESTLFEIALGVQGARVRSKKLMAVAPQRIENQPVGKATDVVFDVTVALTDSDTTEEGRGAKGGAGINISVVRASIDADGSVRETTRRDQGQTHRISFSIPVYLAAHFREPDDLIEDERILREVIASSG